MLQPHAVLQIKPNSSEEDVKAAYKRRALETHPDKGGDVAEFRAVRLAYEQLTKDSASSGPAPARESGGPQQQKSGGVAPFPRGFEDLFAGFAAPPPSRLRGDARKRRRRTLEESIDEAFAAIPIPVYRPRPASPRPPPPRRQPPDSPATPQKSTTATRPPKAASAQQPRAAPKAPAPTPVAQMWAKLLSLDPEKRKKAIGNLPATAKQQLKDYLQALKARQTNDSSSSSSEGGGSSSSSSSDSEGDSSAAPPSSVPQPSSVGSSTAPVTPTETEAMSKLEADVRNIKDREERQRFLASLAQATRVALFQYMKAKKAARA